MRHELFFEYNPWWEGDHDFDSILSRANLEQKIESLMPEKTVILLTGLRRVGKTTLMKLAIKKLLLAGIDPRQIFYISLDEYLLKNYNILDQR